MRVYEDCEDHYMCGSTILTDVYIFTFIVILFNAIHYWQSKCDKGSTINMFISGITVIYVRACLCGAKNN